MPFYSYSILFSTKITIKVIPPLESKDYVLMSIDIFKQIGFDITIGENETYYIHNNFNYNWDEYTLEVGTKEYGWTYVPADAVNYKGKTGKVEFTVLNPEVREIKVEQLPSKTEYKVGEEINTEGLVIKVTYTDGRTENITEKTRLKTVQINPVSKCVI